MYVLVEQRSGDLKSAVVLTDTVSGLGRLRQDCLAFIASASNSYRVPAAQAVDVKPGTAALGAILFRKTTGPLLVRRTEDRELEIAGRTDLLERYAQHLRFGEDGGHRHPEQAFHGSEVDSRSEMIVIEAIPDDES